MQPPTPDTLICYCNDLTIADIAEYIKKYNITTVAQIIEDEGFSCGNSCEACHEEGYRGDGYSLAMVLGMVKRGYI